MTTTTKNVKIEQATKNGDWVLPIIVNGVTVYALQVNKSKEDKSNIDAILQEYANADITVYTYKGKNNADVLLVDATQKIRATRTSATTEKLIASAISMFGVSEEQARAMIANAKK